MVTWTNQRHLKLCSLSLVMVIFISSATLRAQLTNLDTASWSGKVGLQGMWLSGNVERLFVLTNAELSHVTDSWGIKSVNTYQYGTFGPRLTESDFITRNFVYLNPKSTLYPYLMLWGEKNLRRLINYRFQGGVGGTIALLSDSVITLKASLTATYETTQFSTGKVIELSRLTCRAFMKLASASWPIRFSSEVWVQPSLSGFADTRAHLDSIIEFPLSRQFSLLFSAAITYESFVESGVERLDQLFVLGGRFGF